MFDRLLNFLSLAPGIDVPHVFLECMCTCCDVTKVQRLMNID